MRAPWERKRHREDEIEELRAEIERLRAALSEMIEITKRNSEAELMLIGIRTCAEHALADQGKGNDGG